MTVLVAAIGGMEIRHPIGDAGVMGWRWWRRSMIDLGYRDERCVSFGHVDLRPLDIEGTWLLVAMEPDMMLDLVGPFSLFPIIDHAAAHDGVEAFVASVVRVHAEQPVLL